MNEIWKPVKGFESYEVSNKGRIRSYKKYGQSKSLPRILNSCPLCKYGYQNISLCKNSKIYTRMVHRLVLEAFVGKCPEGLECCHNDGDATNNHLDNLRWDTHLANQRQRTNFINTKRGENHPHAKLSDIDVVEIRNLAKQGVLQRIIANKYKIDQSYVSYIVNRKKRYRRAGILARQTKILE